jgi:hypothetical protein
MSAIPRGNSILRRIGGRLLLVPAALLSPIIIPVCLVRAIKYGVAEAAKRGEYWKGVMAGLKQ